MLKIINPADQSIIREVEEDSIKQVEAKFNKVKTFQPKWAATPLSEKIQFIQNFKELLIRNKEELALTLTREMGKPLSQARNEINGTLGRIDFFVNNVEKVLADETVLKQENLEEQISLEPLGVVANISAWNYPYFVGSNAFIPALLTGNTVLYKPSEFATLTGISITQLLHNAGIPEDAFQVVIGGGSVGAALLNQNINGVFFTGSYATGKKIAEACAGKMIKVQLELGGKDPVYVCEDVNVNSVAAGIADGAFYNTGQSCCSVERIYVQEKIYDQFVSAFVKEVQTYVMGNPEDEKTYIAPLTRAAQLSFLEEQVQDAKAKGAKLLTGGKRVEGKGNYFEPTVFSNVHHEMKLMKEESFGPIIGIQKVKDDAESTELMNDSPYGLTSAVYTVNKSRAEKILSQMNSGSVYWNCCDRVSPNLPWTGRGQSGIGSTLSKYGILGFVQPKGWHLRG